MHLLREIIRNNKNIETSEYQQFLASVIENKTNKNLLIALIAALSAKPLNLNDILNFVTYLEKDAPKRTLDCSDEIINIVGTGGGISTFNISTTAAFLAAACGVKVLKSGSNAYNSQCGSLDILSYLGVKTCQTDDAIDDMIRKFNIGFVSPTLYPPALRRIAVSILPLQLRDIGGFINLIGPLLCPYVVKGQICGVSKHQYLEPFAEALKSREINNSLTVYAEVGMDEFSAVGRSFFAETTTLNQQQTFCPSDYGITHADKTQLLAGSTKENAEILLNILQGKTDDARSDTVAINAAFMILMAGKTRTISDALALAKKTLHEGEAYTLLQEVVGHSEVGSPITKGTAI